MGIRLRRNRALACVALATWLMAASAFAVELTPWNQENVTAIAAELLPATRSLRESLRQKPPLTLGQPGQRAFWSLRDKVRSIESTARQLHDALAAGEGRDETFPTYRRMILTVRRADRELQRIPTVAPVEQNVQAVADILKRLRTYYEPEPVI